MRLGVVDRYETDEVDIPTLHAEAIAEATGVPVAWIVGGSETPDHVFLLERLQREVEDLRARLERVEGGLPEEPRR